MYSTPHETKTPDYKRYSDMNPKENCSLGQVIRSATGRKLFTERRFRAEYVLLWI